MTSSRRLLLSGASGLIGRRLADSWREQGHDVVRLVRREPDAAGEYLWDPYHGYVDERALKGLDAVVHLSGAGIGDRRWTSQRKEVLYKSRVITTRVLAEHLAAAEDPPEVFVSQSAVGIYGDRGDEILDERSSVGSRGDFIASLTMDWETAAMPAAAAGIRVVHPRTGIVLDRGSQLIERLVPLYRAGLGGPLGSGRQWWSWISLSDVVRATELLIESRIHGPVNLVSPNPVRQREFAKTLASALHRPSVLPVPKLGLRLALGGEKAAAIGYSSTRVTPSRLVEHGFTFEDSQLAATLRSMVG